MSVETLPRQHVVGRYVLEREIGAGGMASVYLGRAHGAAGFSRVVAIKRLHPQFAKDKAFAGAMIDEARLAARISHANVVQIIDVVVDDGELLVVMELLRGEALSRLMELSSGPLPLDVVGKIGLDVLNGLHAAHEVRDDSGRLIELVHRDVSPQNVMVGTDGTARLIDFGVAKAIGRMQQTTDGRLKGKIGYFAPETIRSGQVDRRIDVYATGVMLWEMLTGSRLFRGENELQVLSAIMDKAVPPPSSMVAAVPPTVDAVVLRALSKNPEERFQNAEDMGDALDAALVPARAKQVGDWVKATAEGALADREAALSGLASTVHAAYDSPTTADAGGASDPQRTMAEAPIAKEHSETRRILHRGAVAAQSNDAPTVRHGRSEPQASSGPATHPSGPPVTLPLESAKASDAPVSDTAASDADAATMLSAGIEGGTSSREAIAIADTVSSEVPEPAQGLPGTDTSREAYQRAREAWMAGKMETPPEYPAPRGSIAAEESPKRAARWPWLAGLLLLVAAAVAAAVMLRSEPPEDIPPLPAAKPEPGQTPQALPPKNSTPKSAVSLPATAPTPPKPTTPPKATLGTPPATATPKPKPTPAAPAKPTTKSRVNCDPAYTLGPKGQKIWKPECVRSPQL